MRMFIVLTLTILIAFIGISAWLPSGFAVENGVSNTLGDDLMDEKPENYPLATFAGGCFWCVESEFRALEGVLYTRVGYIGGHSTHPTYEDITTGQTGHAEAVEITYDPEHMSYEDLVTFFLTKAHDPTQVNRQGVDIGTQYRSAIFYHNPEQKEIAARLIAEINNKQLYNKPIATKVSKASTFWLAEGYHQQYYEKYEAENKQVHPRVFFKNKMKMLGSGPINYD